MTEAQWCCLFYYAVHVMDKTAATETCYIMDSYLEERWIVVQVKKQSEFVIVNKGRLLFTFLDKLVELS